VYSQTLLTLLLVSSWLLPLYSLLLLLSCILSSPCQGDILHHHLDDAIA
jgi:hypothetical protein